jgi:membrane-bound lytic murein transglycosylase
MKKLMIATSITVVVLTGCVYSQQSAHALATANVQSSANVKPKANVKASKAENYLNNINVRAMRDFVGRFGDAENVKWHNSKDGFIAVFFRDSIQHRVMYTSRGDLNFIMKYYEEKQMARNIRAQVKSTWYDYKIFVIQEIEMPDRPTIYIVNLQGEKDWKKVRICQGEMEVMEEFKKG